MTDDFIEMPVQRCLFRQSSLETRLSPQPPLKCSDSEDEDTPKIIGAIQKQPTQKGECKDLNERKLKINILKNELENKFIAGMSVSPTYRKTSEEMAVPLYAQVNKDDKKKNRGGDEFAYYTSVSEVKPQVTKSEILPKPSVARISQSFESEPSFVPVYADLMLPNNTLQQNQSKQKSTGPIYADIMQPKEPSQQSEKLPNLKYEKVSKGEEKSKSSQGRLLPSDAKKTVDTVGNMATLRPKSPRPPVTKQEKEESLWDKIGTLGRKKRIKEVREVEAEGKNAIDSPGNPVMLDYPPEEYELDENEERCMVDQHSLEDPKVRDLIQVLIDWINDELAEQRIIVQDIMDDLYDGQVLQKLLERLTGDKLNEPEVTQSEEGQKHKLAMVLDDFNRVLSIPHYSVKKWGVESIHSKNIVAILYLLVALARHFRAPIRLPEHVTIKTHVVQKSNGQLVHRTVHEHVTSAYDDVGMRCERDAFDTLFDHAPDKLQVVKKSMVTFVNKHLNKINLEVTDLETQFSDGVYLVLLMGLLEGFFVPLHCFSLTPKEFDQKVHNVAFAFDLMEEVGISRPKARPEDIVNLDLKSTLRVLYKLFSKYKDIA